MSKIEFEWRDNPKLIVLFGRIGQSGLWWKHQNEKNFTSAFLWKCGAFEWEHHGKNQTCSLRTFLNIKIKVIQKFQHLFDFSYLQDINERNKTKNFQFKFSSTSYSFFGLRPLWNKSNLYLMEIIEFEDWKKSNISSTFYKLQHIGNLIQGRK